MKLVGKSIIQEREVEMDAETKGQEFVYGRNCARCSLKEQEKNIWYRDKIILLSGRLIESSLAYREGWDSFMAEQGKASNPEKEKIFIITLGGVVFRTFKNEERAERIFLELKETYKDVQDNEGYEVCFVKLPLED